MLRSEADVAQLRVALRLADGADEVELREGGEVSLSPDNPFNSIALWGAGFEWDPSALKRAFDAVAPIARNALGVYSRSSRSTMMRSLPTPRPPPARDP